MRKIRIKPALVTFMLAVGMIGTTACSTDKGKDTTSEVETNEHIDVTNNSQVYFTVGDEEVTQEEVIVYSLMQLLEGGITYMNVLADETYVETDILNDIRTTKILYKEAMEQGVTMDESEMEVVYGLRDNFMDYVTDDIFQEFGVTEEMITKVFTEVYTVDKFETDKQNEIGKTLNEEILAEVEDYNFQTMTYIIMPIVQVDEEGNPLTDESGNPIKLDEAEVAKIKETANSIIEEINAGGTPTEVAAAYGYEQYCEEQVGYVGAYSEELNDLLGTMEVGTCTPLYENDNCYYTIALTSNYNESVKQSYAYTMAKEQLEAEYASVREEWLAKVPTSDEDFVDNHWTDFPLAAIATSLFEVGLMQ